MHRPFLVCLLLLRLLLLHKSKASAPSTPTFALRKIGSRLLSQQQQQQQQHWVIGKRHDRRLAEGAHEEARRRLERLRVAHRALDARIRAATGEFQLKQLKQEKLALKDEIKSLEAATAAVVGTESNLLEIGVGTFSKVLHGTNMQTGDTVAVKLAKTQGMLLKEYLILQRLHNEFGFPSVHLYGRQEILNMGSSVVLVMDLLGPSVESLLFHLTLGTNRGFSSGTVLHIAKDVLHRLQALGRHGIVHGDLHPGNVLLGVSAGSNRTCHLIDFGRSSLSAVSPGTDTSAMFRGAGLAPSTHAISDSAYVAGTMGFSSAATLCGAGGLERDDVESLAYTLAYLLSGRLPDFVVSAPDTRRVAAAKARCSTLDLLCGEAELAASPAGLLIAAILDNVRSLPQHDRSAKPDYDALLAQADPAPHAPLDWEAQGIHWSPDTGIVVNQHYT